jgi:hypothetical protein
VPLNSSGAGLFHASICEYAYFYGKKTKNNLIIAKKVLDSACGNVLSLSGKKAEVTASHLGRDARAG